MSISKQFWVLSTLWVLLVGCKDDNNPSLTCDQQLLVSESELDTAPRDGLVINNLEIQGDCLFINFSASGCSGDTWQVQLIGSELVMESLPPQRGILLSLDNDEACEAVITREMTFDITAAQVQGPSIWLNFINSSDQILYEYN